jgi:lipopolysaccharide export system protein LptC
MKLAMPGPALRALWRPGGELKAAIQETAASWLFAAWPSTVPENRHSRRVALLKRLLPAIGLALLMLIAVWPRLAPLWDRMRLAFPAIDLREAGELRMVSPRYAGVDRLGRPFVVTAAVGHQAPDRQDLMSLEAPRADIKIHRDADLVVTAATGIYQSQAQLLDLFGDVTLVHQDGTRFVTDTARVDVANSLAEGGDPVVGRGPSGDVDAEGFRILDKGDTIIFTGKSDVLLKAAKPGTEKRAPVALPAQIAVAAARTAVDAKPLLAAAKPASAAAKPAAGRHPATPRRHTARPAHGAKAAPHAKPAAPKKI